MWRRARLSLYAVIVYCIHERVSISSSSMLSYFMAAAENVDLLKCPTPFHQQHSTCKQNKKKRTLTCWRGGKKNSPALKDAQPQQQTAHSHWRNRNEVATKVRNKKITSSRGGTRIEEEKSMRETPKIDDINSRRACLQCHCCCCNRKMRQKTTQVHNLITGQRINRVLLRCSVARTIPCALSLPPSLFHSFSFSCDTFHPFRPFYLFIFCCCCVTHKPRGIYSRCLEDMRSELCVCVWMSE